MIPVGADDSRDSLDSRLTPVLTPSIIALETLSREVGAVEG